MGVQAQFTAETSISLALACPRINRSTTPRGMGAGGFVSATFPHPQSAKPSPISTPRQQQSISGTRQTQRDHGACLITRLRAASS